MYVGASLLSEKKTTEAKALQKQLAPPNYRSVGYYTLFKLLPIILLYYTH